MPTGQPRCPATYPVQVLDGLRDENGGVLCRHAPLALRHTGELTRPRPGIMHRYSLSEDNFYLLDIVVLSLLINNKIKMVTAYILSFIFTCFVPKDFQVLKAD